MCIRDSIQAAWLHVRADRTERREVLRYGDFQYARLADVIECIGVSGAGAKGQGGEQGTQQGAVKCCLLYTSRCV